MLQFSNDEILYKGPPGLQRNELGVSNSSTASISVSASTSTHAFTSSLLISYQSYSLQWAIIRALKRSRRPLAGLNPSTGILALSSKWL
jgi:hypothetical protein